MPTLLTSGQYDEVRAAIGPDLTSADLPDSVIDNDQYSGQAEWDVRRLDPLADSRTGDDFRKVRTAAVLLCAARLIHSQPDITRESFAGQFNYGKQARDPAMIASQLRQDAYRLLADVLGVSLMSLISSTQFTVAQGRRGDLGI